MQRPLCFVLMPFGSKPDGNGGMIDFDAVYRQIFKPTIEAAGLEPIRADEEKAGGIIHKPMFERLILCPFAVADLTTANANVFYELGVRHATRPATTVLVFADGGRLPFDVSPLRAMPYKLAAGGSPADADRAGDVLRDLLLEAKAAAAKSGADSPLYQLVENFPDVQRMKTDVFRDRVDYAEGIKTRLRAARDAKDADAVRSIDRGLGSLDDVEAGVLVDLMLSYRALEAWNDMVMLVERMPKPLSRTVMVREQLGFALNRCGRHEDAARVLQQVIDEHGPSSETYGLLGRVFKDQWEKAFEAKQQMLARGFLDRAVSTYVKGFEADWRDAYPGVNAVTMMELKESADPRQKELLPIVRYAVERRIAAGNPDYWDYATLVELAVLARDRDLIAANLGSALAAVREPWEPKTTARNLRLISEARARRREDVRELEEVIRELERPRRRNG
jgi:tetratricopeptide (TPR) repeat protein